MTNTPSTTALPNTSPVSIAQALDRRYTTKEYDSSKKITDEHFAQIKNLLRMSASSTNVQPWHFIIASTDEGKARINKGCEGMFHFNAPKVSKASHVIVFCARTELDEAFLHKVLDKEDIDGRYAKPEHKQGGHDVRTMFINMHREAGDLHHWTEKQTYLNMGGLLLGASMLGIDATPMEGVDLKALDEEFGLRQNGLASFAVVSLGYRAEGDFNANLPKSRLSEADILQILD